MNTKNKGTSHVPDEMENLMHHDEQELLSMWEGWHWDDNKGKMHTRVLPERRAYVRQEKAPIPT